MSYWPIVLLFVLIYEWQHWTCVPVCIYIWSCVCELWQILFKRVNRILKFKGFTSSIWDNMSTDIARRVLIEVHVCVFFVSASWRLFLWQSYDITLNETYCLTCNWSVFLSLKCLKMLKEKENTGNFVLLMLWMVVSQSIVAIAVVNCRHIYSIYTIYYTVFCFFLSSHSIFCFTSCVQVLSVISSQSIVFSPSHFREKWPSVHQGTSK